MKQIRATTMNVKRKSVSLDTASVRKLAEVRKYFNDAYSIDVTDTALIRRAIDKYHRFVRLKLQQDKVSRLILDEPDRVYRAAQPGNGRFIR